MNIGVQADRDGARRCRVREIEASRKGRQGTLP